MSEEFTVNISWLARHMANEWEERLSDVYTLEELKEMIRSGELEVYFMESGGMVYLVFKIGD